MVPYENGMSYKNVAIHGSFFPLQSDMTIIFLCLMLWARFF